MNDTYTNHISAILNDIKHNSLWKTERNMMSAQAGRVSVEWENTIRPDVINLCSNNYLGLANSPKLIDAAKKAMDSHGYGMASVRFICGTQDLHQQLEKTIASFLGKDDSILFAACFDANGGLFEPLLTEKDAIISDSLNHASIIDGIRLCKAKRYRYQNSDMADLELQLETAKADGARFIFIATDGVFSMDGYLAKLPEITDLAERFNALVMIDDCHSTGIMGPGGRGTAAHFGVEDRIDIISGTLGKALGGAIGGFIAGAQPVIDLLRQRARPYLFSNALPPSVVAAAIEAFRLVEHDDALRTRLFDNARYWRRGLAAMGFELLPGEHPIVPVLLGDAQLAQDMSQRLFEQEVYASGFFYPVVPEGLARIRTQMSAAHSQDDLDQALAAFGCAGKSSGALSS